MQDTRNKIQETNKEQIPKINLRFDNLKFEIYLFLASCLLFFCCSLSFAQFNPSATESAEYSKYPKIKVLQTVYYAHHWSDYGRYKRVSKNKKRIGNTVACNFLPGGSIIMIPELFKTTKFEVADTFGGKGYGFFKGEKYWKVDVLRNKSEWIDDFDHPLDMYIVKYNNAGPVKNSQVARNCQVIQNMLYNNDRGVK